jgi:hypothetical protein
MTDNPIDRLRAIFPRYVAKIEELGTLCAKLPVNDVPEACLIIIESMEALADEMRTQLCPKCDAALEKKIMEKDGPS